MRLPAYPAYKPSGAEWLGDTPEHWNLGRIGRVFHFRSGGTPTTSEADYWEGHIPWVSAKDMKALRIADSEDHITPQAVAESASSMVPAGSVLLVARSGILKHTLPVAVTERPVAINQDIKGLLPVSSRIESLFFAYWVQANQLPLLTLWRQQGATVESLDVDTVKTSIVPLPPVAEQRAIAELLDRETAKIDTLVAKKRTLIQRLREKRTALISRTVTRGLPPDAARAVGLDQSPRLKPSGIDWLGDVPEHWDLKPLGYLVRFQGGATPDKGNDEYWDGDIPWVSPKDMKRSRIADAEDHISLDGLRNSPLLMVPAAAVLIVVRGMILAHSFPVAIAEGALTINQDMKALICGKRVEPEFLAWVLAGLSRALVSLTNESAHGTKRLETGILAKFQIGAPPLDEQREIANFLDRETTAIDRMLSKVDVAIERLQEYRAALITAAVTGKIDVRGVVA